MIKQIKEISNYYKAKNIYVWNVNRSSTKLFFEIAFQLVDVKGFVSPDPAYVGLSLFNRPIIDIDDFS